MNPLFYFYDQVLLLSIYNSVFMLLLATYPLQVLRLSIQNRADISSYKHTFYYALSNVVGKFPQFVGMMRFVLNKWQGRRGTLIEYK